MFNLLGGSLAQRYHWLLLVAHSNPLFFPDGFKQSDTGIQQINRLGDSVEEIETAHWLPVRRPAGFLKDILGPYLELNLQK